jgi:hypothetical protein
MCSCSSEVEVTLTKEISEKPLELSRRRRHRLTIIEQPSLSEASFANTLRFRLSPARLLRKADYSLSPVR